MWEEQLVCFENGVCIQVEKPPLPLFMVCSKGTCVCVYVWVCVSRLGVCRQEPFSVWSQGLSPSQSRKGRGCRRYIPHESWGRSLKGVNWWQYIQANNRNSFGSIRADLRKWFSNRNFQLKSPQRVSLAGKFRTTSYPPLSLIDDVGQMSSINTLNWIAIRTKICRQWKPHPS